MSYVYLGVVASLLSSFGLQVPSQIASVFSGSSAATLPCEQTASESDAVRHAQTLDPAGLGIVKCAGGTESVTFDSGSIDYSQDTNIARTLQNSMGSVITSCIVKIKRVGTQGHPPTSGTVKINGVQQQFQDGSALFNGLSIPSGSDAIPIRIKLDSARNLCEQFTLRFQSSTCRSRRVRNITSLRCSAERQPRRARRDFWGQIAFSTAC